MSITIRKAGPDDTATVADFNARLALETENRELDMNLLTPGVRAMLSDTNKGSYFLACFDDKIIGQLAITYEWSDWRNGWFWWFQSVYIIPEARREGVFALLYRYVQDAATAQHDVCGLRLYVDDNNTRAQQVYASQGMKAAGYRVMELDFRQQENEN